MGTEAENNKTEEYYSVPLPESILCRVKVIEDVPGYHPEEPKAKENPYQREEMHEDAKQIALKDESVNIEIEPDCEDSREKAICDMLTKEELNSIVKKAKYYRYSLKELLKDSCDLNVRKLIEAYCDEQYLCTLGKMPIEELNFRKSGIRVNMLRSAGYGSIYDIKDSIYSEMMNIYGIGEKNARMIIRERDALTARIRSSITVRPKCVSGDESRILAEYYKYIEVHRLYKIEYVKYNNVDTKIGQYLKEIGCCSVLLWRLLPQKLKERISFRAVSLKNILTDELMNSMNASLHQRQNAGNVSIQKCYGWYRKNTDVCNRYFDTHTRAWAANESSAIFKEKSENDGEHNKLRTILSWFLLVIVFIFIVFLLVKCS